MKRIVISAVNIRKGGTLTILRQCLSFLSSVANENNYQVIALVHKQKLADYPNIKYIELPWSIEGWIKRLWCEYVTMNKLSKQIKKEYGEIDLWLSLHDTTPRVQAKRQAVYCQTSFPFFAWKFSDFRFDKKIPLFALFTRYAYRINIHKNKYLIVQQEWLRKGFSKMFGIAKDKFIVAPARQETSIPEYQALAKDNRFTFFYASTPDSHKNFETLCKASTLLEERIGKDKFQTILTVKGDENAYAQYLKENWGNVSSIKFAGLMDKATLYAHYNLADCFVFPSRIETWGLPISEFMVYDKPMILSDLPYAHETSQGSSKTSFFPSCDASSLAEQMFNAYYKNYASFSSIKKNEKIQQPFAQNWHELFNLLLK